jgi:hypothetical protein
MPNSANYEDHHQTLISSLRNKRPSRVSIGFLNAANVFAQGTRSQRTISALRPRKPFTLGVANAHLGAKTLPKTLGTNCAPDNVKMLEGRQICLSSAANGAFSLANPCKSWTGTPE